MIWDWSKHSRHLARIVAFALTSVGGAGLTNAQDHTADPYKPYNQQYEQFVYPSYPSGFGLMPNQGVLEGRSSYGANQFQRFLNESEADDLGPNRRRSGPGIPYYSAYRQYDREYGRVYQPNQASDENYYKDRDDRHEKYLAYLKERDPKKRAELYRAYTEDAKRVARDLANPRSNLSRRNAAGGPGVKDENRKSAAEKPGADRSSASAERSPARRDKMPSEVLKENEDVVKPARPRVFTAPGLAPRSGAGSNAGASRAPR